MIHADSEASGYQLTQKFIEEMLTEFREQRKIHRRFAFQIIMEVSPGPRTKSLWLHWLLARAELALKAGRLTLQALECLRALPSLVDIAIPAEEHFTVCGDVHGQFYDLLNIFELNGLPSQQNPYLFNGEHSRSRSCV